MLHFLSRRTALPAGVIVILTATVFSQQRQAAGVSASYNVNIHSADFRSFPGVPSCCPKYENGKGGGLTVGLLYQAPLGRSWDISVRLDYSVFNGDLIRTENEVLSGGVNGAFRHQVQSKISDVGFEPFIRYNVMSSLWVKSGARIGYLTGSSFSQKEEVVTPGFLFSTGSSIRNVVDNALIPNVSVLQYGLIAGVDYDLPLNPKGTVILAPELLYYQPFSNVVQNTTWKVSQLRIGATFKWSPASSKEKKVRDELRTTIDTVSIAGAPQHTGYTKGVDVRSEEVNETDNEIVKTLSVRRTDTLRTARKSSLSATISASGLYDDGRETSSMKLEVEEFSSVLMTPLLNYVFFEENSDEIPERYKRLDERTRERFKEERINNPDRLLTYYQILNIVGKRLRMHTAATVTLVGCNSDIGAEKGDTKLSQNRADAVKKYLLDIWQVQESRIKTEARNLPVKSANTTTRDGAQENRRVEILSSEPEVIAPIITNDTLKTVTPPSVRFRGTVVHDDEIAAWSLIASQDNMILKRFDGTGNIPRLLDWNVDTEKGTQPKSNSDIRYELFVRDIHGEEISSRNTIPVEQITIKKKKIERIADKEIQRFSLILFDVRSSEISVANQRIISSVIRPFISERSEVSIVGYTDRLGEHAQNQQLADGRAEATAKELKVAKEMLSVRGIGNASTFNQELPEGRLYTRTVDIVIQTPVQ